MMYETLYTSTWLGGVRSQILSLWAPWLNLAMYVGCRLPRVHVFWRQDIAVKHEG